MPVKVDSLVPLIQVCAKGVHVKPPKVAPYGMKSLG